ncbi:MAG: helix-turn-helix domain-containing protein [Streptosporangiales bacterium]|nr:helix-turn-helix domain-containing protein [Streptosporangiales bacterium]
MYASFGDRLRALMYERGIGVRALARKVPCDPGYISRLRNGREKPSPELARLLDDILNAGGELAVTLRTHNERPLSEEVDPTKRRDALKLALVAPLAPDALRRVLRQAAAEAMEFTRLASISAVGPGTLQHLEAVVAELDRSYSTEPPTELFAITRAYRIRVEELVHGSHTLKEARELYVYAGWLSEVLAWLAHDLGDPLTAEAFAIDCHEHAHQAGHDELCAWATDAMASIALYTGQPERAVTAAHKGIARVPASHPLAVRLRAQAGRAYARLGRREECVELLSEARELHERLPARAPTRFGIDTAALADYAMTAYPASAYVWLGEQTGNTRDYTEAKRYAEHAVAVHERAPAAARSPSRSGPLPSRC